MNCLPLFILGLSLTAQHAPQDASSIQGTKLSPALASKLSQMSRKLRPSARIKVHAAGLELLRSSLESKSDAKALAVQAATSKFQNAPNGSLDALVALILGAATNADDADLKTLIGELNKLNKQKQALRNLQTKLLKAHDLSGTAMPMHLQAPPHSLLPNSQADYIRAPANLTAPDELSVLSKQQASELAFNIRNATYLADQGLELDTMKFKVLSDKRSEFFQTLEGVLNRLDASKRAVIANVK